MTPAALIAQLAGRGIALSVEGADVVVEAPDDQLTPDVLDLVREHKAGLVAAMAPTPALAVAAPPRCSLAHVAPEIWIHRAGRAWCPTCGKFLGRLPGHEKI